MVPEGVGVHDLMVGIMASGRLAWCWSSNGDLIAEREEGGKKGEREGEKAEAGEIER